MCTVWWWTFLAHQFSLFVEAIFFHFAIQRRAADGEPARHLRHLPAIMLKREANGLSFEIIETAHFAMIIDKPARMRIAHFNANDFTLDARGHGG